MPSSSAPAARVSKGVLWLRLAVFGAAALWICGAPSLRQVFGVETMAVREWRMYGTRGLDVCVVKYQGRAAGEPMRPLSRLDTLGIRRDSPKWRRGRRIRDKKEARREGKKMCDELGLEELRFRMRCADAKRGWRTRKKESENLCDVDLGGLRRG